MAKRKKIEEETEPESYVVNLHNEEVEIINAPLYRRVVAYIIDLFFFYLVLFQIFFMIYLPVTGIPTSAGFSEIQDYLVTHPSAAGKMIIGVFGATVVYFLYFVLVEKEFGTTVGKYVMKLKVVSVNHHALSYLQTLTRNLTKTVFWPLIGIDLLGVTLTKEKQRFSDILAGTKVIYKGNLDLVYGELD